MQLHHPLRDYELGTVLERRARVVDGPTALNYVRAPGHHRRQWRLQAHQTPAVVLSSLLRSSTDTLFSRLNNVVNMFIGNSYVDNVKTKDLVELGRDRLRGIWRPGVTFVTVPTEPTDQNGDEPPRTPT